jgi:Quinohemoprotein amine dehydrogenase, alpha subunit domain III
VEIFFGNENGTSMHGRRLLTPIGDLGMDETLYKVGGGARLLTAIPKAIQTGKTTKVRLFGINLPANIRADAISLGDGIKVKSVSQSGGDTVVAEVVADGDAKVGPRTIKVASVDADQALYLRRSILTSGAKRTCDTSEGGLSAALAPLPRAPAACAEASRPLRFRQKIESGHLRSWS